MARQKLSPSRIKLGTRPSSPVASLVSVVEYRKLLKDTSSMDEEILKRLEYLESLCRVVIKEELNRYANEA